MAYDAIIVGSGFGGAVSALRLAEAGLRVLVLERGRRWTPETLPRRPGDPWLWHHRDPSRGTGWLDLRRFRHMAVAQGAAVGGGSHIYANISVEAPPASFARGWPAEIDHAVLKPFSDTVADVMEVGPVPAGQWTKRMELMRDAAAAAGYAERFRQVDLAVRFDPGWTYERDGAEGSAATRMGTNKHGAPQGTCVHLGTCDIGCAVSARNTLDLNYLYVAENRYRAEVRALHLVDRVEPRGTGWRVHFDRLDGGEPGAEDAEVLILAAGSLGSTELLLRNRDVHGTLDHLSPRLGQGWSANGDFLTPAVYAAREVDASRGPTIASIIDFEDGSVGGHQFWIQDGGIPDVVRAFLDGLEGPGEGLPARILVEWLKSGLRDADPLRAVMPWFAQGVDAADGTLSLDRSDGRVDLDWDVAASRPLMDTIVAMHKRLAAATGGVPVVPPSWSLLKYLVTPHPLGGCNMGADATRGVVDHAGAVFGHPGLFVLDGAVVPRALGVNPSRTIAALAERGAGLIARGRTARPPSPAPSPEIVRHAG